MSLPVTVLQRDGDLDQIRARLADVCTWLNQGHAELVTLTGQLIDTGSWAGVGIRSRRHWLTVYAGLSPARARQIVRLANRRDQLPETVQAMADGRLSLDQAAVIAAYVPGSHSADATEFATLATVPQLRRSLSRYAFTEPEPEPEPEPEAAAEAGAAADGMPDTGPDRWSESARLSMGTQDGRFHLRFSAPASIGALLERAIREAKDALFTAGQTDATLADGLIEMANRSLSTVAGTARADKYRVYVHLDTRGGLPAHQLDRIVCDGVIHPVWETAGTPVNVGRAMRIVPTATRRLLEARDQGCRYPGCAATSPLDNHHLTSWRHGGVTDSANLLSLCPTTTTGSTTGSTRSSAARPAPMDCASSVPAAGPSPPRPAVVRARTAGLHPATHSKAAHPPGPDPRANACTPAG